MREAFAEMGTNSIRGAGTVGTHVCQLDDPDSTYAYDGAYEQVRGETGIWCLPSETLTGSNCSKLPILLAHIPPCFICRCNFVNTVD